MYIQSAPWQSQYFHHFAFLLFFCFVFLSFYFISFKKCSRLSEQAYMFMNYFNADNQVDQTHRWHSSDSRFDFVRWWTNVFRIHMNNRSYAIFFSQLIVIVAKKTPLWQLTQQVILLVSKHLTKFATIFYPLPQSFAIIFQVFIWDCHKSHTKVLTRIKSHVSGIFQCLNIAETTQRPA